MATLDKRFTRSVEQLNALGIGEAALFWAALMPDGLPFFVIVPQARDPDGSRLVKRAKWVAAQQAPALAVRGVVRRLPSGLLSLSTTTRLDGVGAIYAGLCRRAEMPDVLLMQLDGQRIVATRLLQDLSAVEDAVGALSPGETRWFAMANDDKRPQRMQIAEDRGALRGSTGVVGKIRCAGDGDFLLRVNPERTRLLGLALQEWGRQVAPWPTLRALSCARIVPRTRKTA